MRSAPVTSTCSWTALSSPPNASTTTGRVQTAGIAASTAAMAATCRSSAIPTGDRGGTSSAKRGGGVSPVEPGGTHDLTAARRHALPVLHPIAVRGLPILADKGYIGAGAGIRVPVRRASSGQVLDTTTRAWNSYVNTTRVFVEHGIAHLKTRWRALARVTLCSWRTTAIVATALMLSN